MHDYQWAMLGLQATWLLFLFAFGACCGSLINVLVYRLPLGLDVMFAGSECPACATKLTWRENIPVFGWILLRGRCRFCRSRISAEYPLVEAFTGALFTALYFLWYIVPADAVWMGVPWGQIRPEWALSDRWDGWPRSTWPMFSALVLLMGALVAMTIVDAKTFTIPLALPWFATVVGVVLHPIGALLVQTGSRGGKLVEKAPGWSWAIATPGGSEVQSAGAWWWIGASIGGMLGIGLGVLFLRFGWMRRSFADYAEWEAEALKAEGLSTNVATAVDPHAAAAANLVSEQSGQGVRSVVRFGLVWGAAIALLGLIGDWFGPAAGLKPWVGLAVGAVIGPIIAALSIRGRAPAVVADDEATPTNPELWIAYPHARREMVKEILFLTPCIGLGWLGAFAASKLAGQTPPLWLLALTGTLMGYLLGGGLVWAIRIGGSLAFGKEAMGLGDVHMMAAVGACLGWIDAVIAVPLAAVVGLYCFVLFALANRPAGRAMPFGPYLAGATLLVVLGKPLIEVWLNWLLGVNIPGSGIPPINLP